MKFEEVGPCIFLYESVLDDCKKIIENLNNNFIWEDSTIGDNEEINTDFRSSKKIPLHLSLDNDLWIFDLAKKIWERGNHYAITQDIFFSSMETPQALKYEKGSGFYLPHADSSRQFPRIFSSVLYLNDVEDGGETYFNKFNITVRPKENTMIVFPSNYAYIHEARPPKSEQKYVVVDWFSP
jgi:hypothetical protein